MGRPAGLIAILGLCGICFAVPWLMASLSLTSLAAWLDWRLGVAALLGTALLVACFRGRRTAPAEGCSPSTAVGGCGCGVRHPAIAKERSP